MSNWREALGFLSVVLALLAAIIYIIQTLTSQVRPHPLSWSLFGVLSATGYWIQRDQGAKAGSWVLLTMTIVCFVLAGLSVVRGERRFSGTEWGFLIAGCIVFAFYFAAREPNISAALTTAIDALAYGPTFTRGWREPRKDSAVSYVLNGVKFAPSLLAMKPISFATCAYPVALLVLNFSVAAMLLFRRRALG